VEPININSSIVTLRDVCFRYPSAILPFGREWLINIDRFSLESRTAYSLFGDNMTGKSTLIQLISGTHSSYPVSCYRGAIGICGSEFILPVDSIKMKKYGLTVIQQSDPMFPELSIWNNIELGCPSRSLHRKHRESVMKRAYDVLKILDPSSNLSLDTPLYKLSGGGKALIRILRATIWGFKILLLDEPTGNLDPANCQQSFILLDEMWKENSSLLLISHRHEDHKALRGIATKRSVNHLCYELKDGNLKLVDLEEIH